MPNERLAKDKACQLINFDSKKCERKIEWIFNGQHGIIRLAIGIEGKKQATICVIIFGDL